MDTLPTRHYLQDIARVMGKVQQTYLPAEPHDWHRGLVINGGLRTAPLPGTAAVILNMQRGTVSVAEHTWQLGKTSPQELMTGLKGWLAAHHIEKIPEEPELTGEAAYEHEQAIHISQMLAWTGDVLGEVKAPIKEGMTSPILLFPHHFDVSLVWFPYKDDRQVSFGFSFGDEHIEGPYFYSSAYPEPAGFTDRNLPGGAYWHDKGFRGAVLLYDIAQRSKEPRATVMAFCKAMASHAKEAFEV
ncbi:MAG TPA: DUF5996 family protein [Candidatus Saccharimonadales bacterium]|nr:DUF5996 family protein [Candidatus Saccharimonadales bacterium]